MSDQIRGLHHITAIASDAQRNLDFYTKVLGLRLVKKTVNFDDPGTYHFYYGNENGTPGTILTFFPWTNIGQGKPGVGMATDIAYAVPLNSLDAWRDRLSKYNVQSETAERFGGQYLSFTDPDGLNLSLVATSDSRKPWITNDIPVSMALRGFHSTTLSLRSTAGTAAVLTDIFGYRLLKQEGNRYRYITDAVEEAGVIDLLELPDGQRGYNAAGTNHHVAFRVSDDNILMRFREKVESKGLQITPKINRDYFFSLYFREPGGVLFEIATDNPGFTVDEPLDQLGTGLKLPKRYEPMRAEIEQVLPGLS